MNSDEVHDLLLAIRRAGGTNAKRGALAANDSPLLREVLYYTYNPYLRYYMKNPVTTGTGLDDIRQGTWNLLNTLASRHLTGHAALSAVSLTLRLLTPKSAALLRRVINKDLKIGVAAKTINQAFPGLIPEHPIMLAQKFSEGRFKGPMYSSPKIDGVRAIFMNGEFRSRRGHKYYGLDALAGRLPDDMILDGELSVPGKPHHEASGLIRSDNVVANAIYNLLDLPELDAPFYERYMIMEDVIGYDRSLVDIVPHNRIDTVEEAYKYYRTYRDMGYEGSVIKSIDYKYQNKRSWDWMKIKAIMDIDLEVIDVYEGEGKYKGQLGGVVVRLQSGRTVNVGGGFSDQQRLDFYREPELIIGRTIEILYHEETPKGSLREPRFTMIREDK